MNGKLTSTAKESVSLGCQSSLVAYVSSPFPPVHEFKQRGNDGDLDKIILESRLFARLLPCFS